MPIPLLLPPAAAAGATLIVGSSLKFINGLNQFQGGPRQLPPLTGREGMPTLEEMIQDAWAGATLPVGSTPPQGGPDPADPASVLAALAAGGGSALQALKGLAGNVAGGAASLWDWLNSRQGPTGGNWADSSEQTTTLPTAQTIRIEGASIFSARLKWCYGSFAPYDLGPSRGEKTIQANAVKAIRFKNTKPINVTAACGEAGNISGTYGTIELLNANGDVITGDNLFQGTFSTGGNLSGQISLTFDIKIFNVTTGQYIPAPGSGQLGARPPGLAPELTQAGQPIPTGRSNPFAPLPQDAPTPSDESWMPEPGTGGTPGDLVWDAPIPQLPGQPTGKPWLNDDGTWNLPQLPTPTVYVPPAVTTWTTTTLAGGVRPAPQPQPQTTPGTTHFVNGTAIGGATARATLEAIATELQRVEEKTARLLQEVAKGQDMPISLGELLALVQSLMDYITGQRTAGSYSLQGPCELDESGNRITKTADYDGGYIIDQISYKLDALAELLQHHKDLKQPTCGEAEGLPSSNVTVHFTEVI